MTRVRQLAFGGALIVGLVTLFSTGTGMNIHSSPTAQAQRPVAPGIQTFVMMNTKTGKIVALGSGVTITMNVKTGQIVNVNSVPIAKH